jgi:hypothetical protein
VKVKEEVVHGVEPETPVALVDEAATGGAKGGAKVIIEPHCHEGVFVTKGKEDTLVTKNLVPGESVYGEKRILVDDEDETKTEYRI